MPQSQREDDIKLGLSELAVPQPETLNYTQAVLDSSLKVAIEQKQAMQDQQQNILDGMMGQFEEKADTLTKVSKRQKELLKILTNLQQENDELKKKNEFAEKEAAEAE